MSVTNELFQALDRAVERAMVGGPTAILFSGGLDSGVLAGVAKRHGEPHLYTVGIEGCHDLRMSEEAARLLDLPWTPLLLSEEDVLAAASETLGIVKLDDPVVLSFELPLPIIAARAKESDLMSGQGADELFGGYNRYLSMGPVDLESNMTKDLAKVLETGAPLDHTIADHYGKAIHHPFLDPAVRQIAGALPPSEKIRDGVRKAPLRDVALSMGLGTIANREKKAAQYGSGFMKVLKSQAKRNGLGLKEFMATLGPGTT